MNAHKHLAVAAISLITLASPALLGAGAGGRNATTDSFYDPKAEYDRLDGAGESHKRVDVIEWEGNLEVHVYPAGSVKGLALKLDDGRAPSSVKPTDAAGAKRKVMVIGYRFDVRPDRQYIRRNILGIPLRAGFNVYKDPSATDYDKFVITNNLLGSELTAYRLDPEPTELFPEGHPENSKTQKLVDGTQDAGKRSPAEASGTGAQGRTTKSGSTGAQNSYDADSGSIKAFDYK